MAVLETTDIKRPTQRDQLTELDAADAFVIEDRTDSKLKYIEKSDLQETLGIDENTANITILKSDDTTEGSVLKSIKDAAEDATFTPTEGSGISATTLETAVNEVGIDVETLKTDKEDKSNKLTTFQETPDDMHYPSEKLVKDSIAANKQITIDTVLYQYALQQDMTNAGHLKISFSEVV